MLCIDDLCEMADHYAPVEYLVREAAQQWELDEAMALRRAVFCIEQGIFARDDRDATDNEAQLLVAMAKTGSQACCASVSACAATTASVRLRTFSARKIAARWILTVPSLMPRLRPISLLGFPCDSN